MNEVIACVKDAVWAHPERVDLLRFVVDVPGVNVHDIPREFALVEDLDVFLSCDLTKSFANG